MTPSSPAKSGSLAQIFARVAPASALVQVFSFASSVVLATQLGATTATDAYYLALSAPLVAYGVLEAAARIGAIPALTKLLHQDPERFHANANDMLGAWIAAGCALSLLVTGVMMGVLPAAAGARPHLASLSRTYMLELAPYAVTGACVGALSALLAVRGRFAVAALALIFEPIVKSVLVLLFANQLGAQGLVLGSLIGNFAAIWLLWGVLRYDGLTLRPHFGVPTPWVRGVLTFSAPLLLSQSVLQLNPLIDRATAAALPRGSVTMFQLGLRLFTAPTVILTSTLITPLTATWSRRLTTDGWEAVITSFRRVVSGILLVVPPLVAAGFIFRREIVQLAYQSHLYDATAVTRTGNVTGMLLLGLVPQMLIPPLASLFLVRGNAIFPLKIGIANAILNATLDVILRGPLGVAGIALSTSITLGLLCCAYVWKARRQWGTLGLRRVLKPALISLGSSAGVATGCLVLKGLGVPAHGRLGALTLLGGALCIIIVIQGLSLRLGRSALASALPNVLGVPVTSIPSDLSFRRR